MIDNGDLSYKNENGQFTISYELLCLLRWLIEHDTDILKKIVHSAVKSGLQNELQKIDTISDLNLAASGIQEMKRGEKRVFDKYIVDIHGNRIHPHFALSFLDSLNKRGSGDPINEWALMATVEMEILESGKIGEIHLVKPSGNLEFDAATIDAVYRASPFPPPPKKILSWNDRAYMRWNFNRNNKRCGVFNVEPYILEKPKTFRTYVVKR